MSEDFMTIDNPHRLLSTGAVNIITAGNGEDDNLFTVAWNMALRKKIPMVAIESGKSHYSYNLIKDSGEFGINIPDRIIAEETLNAGKISGSEVDDKFAEIGLTRSEAKKIQAPMVAEAAAKIECRISQVNDMGASALLIAQILNAEVKEEYYKDGKWNFDNLELIHHMGGNEFAVSSESIEI